MRYLLSITLLLLSLNVLAQAPDLTALDIVERHTPDGPVAVVDGSTIDKEPFLQLYKSRMRVLEKQLPEINDAVRIKTGYQSVGDLVRREILYMEAVKNKLSVSDADVEARFERGLKAQQERAKQSGITAISEDELVHESGKSRAEILASVRKSMLIDKMKERIVQQSGAEVSKDEIKKFYDSRPELFRRAGGFHLQQIFIQPKPSAVDADAASWESCKKDIEKALARIKAGESFEKVAKEASEAKDRLNGGDMGVVAENLLPPGVVTEVRKLKQGELSGPVKSNYGYHIFKLLGTEAEQKMSLADATPKIKEALQQGVSANAVDAFCLKAMQDTERVVVYLKLEKAIASLSPEEIKQLAPSGAN